MSTELNIETMNYFITHTVAPQEREVLSIINPDTMDDNNYNNISPPPLSRVTSAIQEQYVKGEFLYIKSKHTRELLVNAWNVITQTDLWNYIKCNTHSYMLSNDKEIYIITRKMEELGYDLLNSGYSFGWSYAVMQYIAQHGEEQYRRVIITQE